MDSTTTNHCTTRNWVFEVIQGALHHYKPLHHQEALHTRNYCTTLGVCGGRGVNEQDRHSHKYPSLHSRSTNPSPAGQPLLVVQCSPVSLESVSEETGGVTVSSLCWDKAPGRTAWCAATYDSTLSGADSTLSGAGVTSPLPASTIRHTRGYRNR